MDESLAGLNSGVYTVVETGNGWQVVDDTGREWRLWWNLEMAALYAAISTVAYAENWWTRDEE